MPTNAITAEGLVKIYKSRKSEVRALDGIDLEVGEGSVLGLLGPNGAGKTTTVRILATLLKPDAGHATVAGFDVIKQADALRQVIGLSGQFAAVDENLTGRENLWMFGRLYQLSSTEATRRATELLEQFDLSDAGDRVVKTYSGGMRRGSTWEAPSSGDRGSCSWMSRRLVWIRAAGSGCGTSSVAWSGKARRCC